MTAPVAELRGAGRAYGGRACIADVDLALALQRLHHNGDALPEHLAAYAKANWERPSVKKWHALPRERRPV